MTTTPTPASLAERIAEGLLAAAYSCDGTDCRATEDECEAAHPVRRPAPWRYVVRIEGSPEGLAAAVLAVVQPELDALAAVRLLHQPRDHGGWQICTGCSRLGHYAEQWPCATTTAIAAARTPTS
ncbi:hypothetical protein RMN57_13055 [Kitasatospora sp. CM 4170]|uniref:Uncharacterized protein n=1 Tax=Kitasatospora aburaviensis TaxID=67265 RepID=A0ABW1F3J9_9ACTN|nr:hypothetical protein [Kitasatospora sp. CM 4170]WNM45582.1 hypothetical protein RMN57_13055 [Kitasatospora sp. CM 4170]